MKGKLYALSLIFSLASLAAQATHISGGEIYWDCVGPNQYQITLVVYRDCAGINLDNDYDLDITSPCGNTTLNVTTPGGTEISQLCDLALPNSTCNGGSLPGVEQYIYTGIVTLPPCDYWTISWTENWRNNAIVNLQAPGTQLMYIEATLNNIVAPCESSPEFTNLAIPYVCLGYPISYSYGAFDVEGDSMVYSLIGARTTAGAPIPYVAPYTPTSPITGLTLDPLTGLLNFTLNLAGDWVVVVQVDIYDAAGNHIGTIMRDMQFVAYPCTNVPPDPTTGTITGATGGTQTAPYALQVCESGSFCFDMVISDPDAANILDATSNISSNLPGATFSFTGTNPITCHVCWTASAGTAGFYPFIVTVDDGACPIPAFQTYVYEITVIEGVFAVVQATDETCTGFGDGSATVTVTTGTGPYQYLWSTSDTSPSITAGAGSYTVTVTDANGCATPALPAVINSLNQAGVAQAGPDQIACMGAVPIDLNGSVLFATGGAWSGGAGVLSGTWPNQFYTPTAGEIAAGGVDLILNTTGTGGCPGDADTMHVSLSNAFLGASITGTNATCANSTDGTATFLPNDPALTYLWNDPAAQTTNVATGLGAGTYNVLVADPLGCDTSMAVTITAPTAITITGIATVDETCVGSGDGSVTISVSGGTAPYHYTWSTLADTTAMITVGAGTYTVSITDSNGCTPVQVTATVNAAGQPSTANAGPDLIGCMNELPVAVTGSGVNATNNTWSGGAGSFIGTGWTVNYQPTPAEILAGDVDLVLTTIGDPGCPPAMDTVHVALSNSFLGASITTTSPPCAGGNTGTATFLPANPSFTYLWNDPAAQTTNVATGLDAGTYTVTVTDPLGCDTTMTAIVTEPPPLAVTAISTTDATCNGGTNGTATVTTGGGTPLYNVQWDANAGSQTTSTANNLGAGMYMVTITDANGCSVSANAFVGEPAPITLSAQVPDTVCVNAPVQLTAQAAGGNGGYQIGWAGFGINDTITVMFTASQTVSVTVIDGLGCTGPTLTFPVTVLDLPGATLTAYGDTTVCPGGSATIGATLTGYPGIALLTWPTIGMFGTGPFTIPVSGTQTVTVVATDVCGNTITDDVLIQLETPPTVILPAIIAEGCEPLIVAMPDPGITVPITYLWDFGDGSTSTSAVPTHTYTAGDYLVTLTVTTPAGCSSTSNAGEVIVHPNPVAEFTANPWSADIDNANIAFTDGSTGSVNSYGWEFGDGDTDITSDPSHQYNDIGIFPVTLTVTDLNGCTDDVTHTVEILPIYDVVIPNIFTPDPNGGNGGGYDPTDLSNNVFYPFARFVKDFKMRIYDRWGELVFESNDILRGWDGYYRGQMSQQDVYAYQVWIRFIDDREMERIGDLTLLR